ncbi:MAG TPA: hypothetical protein VGQ90_09510, partial [Stellaceae bacterium]|nr:hypothetical protein [Stellaceae bacterium]
ALPEQRLACGELAPDTPRFQPGRQQRMMGLARQTGHPLLSGACRLPDASRKAHRQLARSRCDDAARSPMARLIEP